MNVQDLLPPYDPELVINCTDETRALKQLLSGHPRRLVTILDEKQGAGKSYILEHYEYICRTQNPTVPVVLITKKRLAQPTPRRFLLEVANQLSHVPLKFVRFREVELAMLAGDYNLIRNSLSIRLDNTDFKNSHKPLVAGIVLDKPQVGQMHVSSAGKTLSAYETSVAEQEIFDIFMEELKSHCISRRIAILVDDFESYEDEFKEWFVRDFLERCLFGGLPEFANLAIVLAGQHLPNCGTRWRKGQDKKHWKHFSTMSKWKREDIERCLKIYFPTHVASDVERYYQLVHDDKPALHIIQQMQLDELRQRQLVQASQ
jgi:hypothetical protein